MRSRMRRRVYRRSKTRSHEVWSRAERCKRLKMSGRGVVVALCVGLCPLLPPPTAWAGANPFGCVGDCNQTGHVTITELIGCVRGALLGRDNFRFCFDACDADGNGKIGINEIVLAVKYALDGCPPHR